MKLIHGVLYSTIALTAIGVAPEQASANIFKDIGRAVTHPGRTIKGASKTVGRAVTHPGRSAKAIGHAYMTVARPVGRTVARYYTVVGHNAGKIPILKEAAPLARLGAKIARSKAAQIGFGVATGGALMMGGAAYAATAGGQGAVAAYTLHKGYKAGKAQVRQIGKDMRQ